MSLPGTRLIAGGIVLLGLVAPATGCESRPRGQSTDRIERDSSAIDSSQVAAEAPDTSEASPDAGWQPLAVPPSREPDTFALIVRNPNDVPLIVFADGGAGEVLLDTVPARDSARVRLLIAADSVSLRAVSLDGAAGPAERISLVGQSEASWTASY